MTNLELAITEYLLRKDRRSHPDGTFDSAGRWFPATEESCACCNGLRSPSKVYPYSLMVHCRTANHIAMRYGVEASEIRRGAKTASCPVQDESEARYERVGGMALMNGSVYAAEYGE